MFVTDYEDLKQKIIKKMEELSNTPLDTSPNSFISQFINAIAVADDNILFYISMLMNESNIETALLPETIVQVAKTLGVKLATPKPANGLVELRVQISPDQHYEYDFNETFTLVSKNNPNVMYILDRPVHMIYDNISRKSYVYFIDTNEPIASYISTDNDGSTYVVFNVKIKQLKVNIIDFYADTTIYDYDIENDEGLQRYDIKVVVDGKEYQYVSSIYSLTYSTFTYSVYDKITRVYFATDFVGTPIKEGSHVQIYTYDTYGAQGNVYANTLQVGTNVVDKKTGISPTIIVNHIDIMNGKDADSLIDYKNKMFTEFLSRGTLLSKKYDLENLDYFLEGTTKYNKTVLRRSIAPEFTTFVELELNGNLINTNSIILTDVDRYDLEQDIILTELGNNNTYSLKKSSLYIPQNQIQEDDFTAIVPFSIKFYPDLKIAKYFYLHKRIHFDVIPEMSIISSYDKITSVAVNYIDAVYNPETKKYDFSVYLVVNTPNINDIYNPQIFDFVVEIQNSTTGGIVCGAALSANTLSIEVDPTTNQPVLKFSQYGSLFLPDTMYSLHISSFYQGEFISRYKSIDLQFFSKMNIKSNVKIKEQLKIFQSTNVFDNSVIYPSKTSNLTPEGFSSNMKITFEPTKINFSVYKNSLNTSSFDLRTVNKILVKINSYNMFTTPASATKDTLDFNVQFVTDYVSGTYTIEVILYSDTNQIQYIFHNVQLSQLPFQLKYDIFHVPVIRYKDYKEIIEPNMPDLPYYRLEDIYNKLDEYVILGITHNVKFIKTFGKVLNIKYNKNFTYNLEYIDKIKLPLDLNVALIISNKFDPNVEAPKISNLIKNYQNESTNIETNFKNSELEAQVITIAPSIYSVQIEQPPFDIIYDLDDEIRTQNYNYYTPELITVEDVVLSYRSSYSQ